MKIDNALLNKLENLGMIKIDEDKKPQVTSQLTEIINFFDTLSSVDTKDIREKDSAKTYLREDISQSNEALPRDILKSAPKSEDNYFLVPKIIE